GVGKTTFAAALAKLLEHPQGRVVALDLDPQNSLGAQLGLPPSTPGLSQASHGAEPWNTVCQALPDSPVECLPFGHADAAQLHTLEQHLANEPGWLMQQLATLALTPDDVLIIDLPTGPNTWLAPVLAMADQVVAVTLPDTASYRVLDTLQAWLAPLHQRTPAARCSYLINQVDPTRALNWTCARYCASVWDANCWAWSGSTTASMKPRPSNSTPSPRYPAALPARTCAPQRMRSPSPSPIIAKNPAPHDCAP
ncbi:AAA family ATPase, partial [Pseudomonas sp. MAFF212428]|nr:AAA family ATPase [Pseudomonas brassicae]